MGKKVDLSVEFEAAIGVFKPTREGNPPAAFPRL
jgi:hypothetical protein